MMSVAGYGGGFAFFCLPLLLMSLGVSGDFDTTQTRDERPRVAGDQIGPVHDPQVPGTTAEVPGPSLRHPQLGTGMASSSHKMVASLAKNVPK